MNSTAVAAISAWSAGLPGACSQATSTVRSAAGSPAQKKRQAAASEDSASLGTLGRAMGAARDGMGAESGERILAR